MDLSNLRILIVEDEPIIATDIKSLLLQEGALVVGIAKDGTRALDMLHTLSPNFVVLDIHLGTGPSGIDVAQSIHEKYHLPYIFLTSFSDPTTLSAAQEFGPYGYIVKPFQDKTLLTTILVAWNNFEIMNSKAQMDLSIFPDVLTHQEKNICKELLKGRSYKQISEDLSISMNTLKYHVKNIYVKLDIRGRSALTALFYR